MSAVVSSCASAVQRRPHKRHRPEQTVLHALVREHLPAFLRHAEEHYARPLPKYVRRAFEQYLRCGLPEHGFLRLRCEDCGHDRVVAFSCKQRGTCPSCAGRTMANTAAHLVDRVLPNVPIRQWVLSLPFDLRALAAKHPALVSAIDRILFHEVERWMRRSAGPTEGRAGSITFLQRFGGSINLHVHLHVLFLEGLFTRHTPAGTSEAPVFHPAFAPTRADLLEVLARVRAAVLRWIDKRGLSRARGDPNDDDETDALDACANAAIQQGLFDKLPADSASAHGADHDADEPSGVGRGSVALDGFNLHAAVRVGADDDISRERLTCYCARPPFALERLSVLADGRIAYRIKQPRKTATHRILTPVELLARIAALIPPPRHPFLRYHGVLAPSSKWRSAIVPRPPNEDSSPAHSPKSKPSAHSQGSDRHRQHSLAGAAPERGCARNPGATAAAPSAPPTAPPTAASARPPPPPPPIAGPRRAPFAVLTAAHRARLAEGELLARSARLEWSKLLRRTFAAEVLVCPRCHGQARIIAAVQDPADAERFLAALRELSAPVSSGVHDLDDDESQLPPPSSRPTSLPLPDD